MWKKYVPYICIVAGIIGCLASFVLTYDKIQLIQNPDYNPSCYINPILSCGSVMKIDQANLLGVPNTIFGLIAFSMLFTFGVLLAGGAKVQRWVWLLAQLAATLGVLFMHYLFIQGTYVINAICPWCFVVWMITIPTFWYITLYNLHANQIRLPKNFAPMRLFILKHHGDILAIWYVIIFGILIEHFWYYWSSLF